jgi:hypothetical protein
MLAVDGSCRAAFVTTAAYIALPAANVWPGARVLKPADGMMN